jgi:hypothetical protein
LNKRINHSKSCPLAAFGEKVPVAEVLCCMVLTNLASLAFQSKCKDYGAIAASFARTQGGGVQSTIKQE